MTVSFLQTKYSIYFGFLYDFQHIIMKGFLKIFPQKFHGTTIHNNCSMKHDWRFFYFEDIYLVAVLNQPCN